MYEPCLLSSFIVTSTIRVHCMKHVEHVSQVNVTNLNDVNGLTIDVRQYSIELFVYFMDVRP
jgi:hypothetical protein